MKTRILSALVGIVVLVGILFCPFTWVFAVAASGLAAIAVWEMLHNTGVVSRKSLIWCGMLFACVEVWVCTYVEKLVSFGDWCAWLPLGVLALYGLWSVLAKGGGIRPLSFALYVTAGFVALARLRFMQDGMAYVLLPMVISWMSDTGAYFTGVFFGKHKMAPIISPKKTWEGFFGGWIISVGLTLVFGVLYQAVAHVQLAVSPLQMAVLAVPLAPLSVCGDLLASKIKRQYGIKDYGNIMPGHGGVMDRFDSVVFIAPMLYVLLWLFV